MECIALIFLYITFQLVEGNDVALQLLKHKHIHNALFTFCNKENEIDIQKSLMASSIMGNTIYLNTNLSNYFPTSYHSVGIVVNTMCSHWERILTDDEHMYKTPYKWIIVTKNLTETTETLARFPIELDSDVTIISIEVEDVKIFEVHNTGFNTNGSFKINFIGTADDRWLSVKKTRRMNLSGVVLKCMTVVTTKLASETLAHYLELSKEVRTDTLNKLKFFTLLKYLRDMYNFSYVIKRTKSWGYPSNGTFNGMVGALQRKEIDMGCSPIFFWAERAKVIDYTMQTWQSKQCFIFRHPNRMGAFYTVFTRPLSDTVWYSTVAILVFSGCFLCILLKVKVLVVEGDEPDSSRSLAFLSIWSAMCQQGMSVNRRATSVNLVIFSTFLFSLTLYQYYNATVVSSLLRESPKNIRTLEDLAKSSLKAGIENFPYNLDFLKRTTNPTALKIYHEKIITTKEYNVFDLHEGMWMVKQGGFAFHVDSASGYHYMRRYFSEMEICEAQEVPLFPPMNMVSAVKKGSPYREIITYGLRRMYEVGLFHRIKTTWDEARPDCVRTPDASIFTFTMYEASTPFIALALGIVVSFTVVLCEIIVHNRRKRLAIQFLH